MKPDPRARERQRRVLSYLLAFLAVAFWGASFAATKTALNQLSPAVLIFSRTTIGIMVLAVVALATRSMVVRISIPLWQLVLLGFLGIAFHQGVQAEGLKTTSTTDTGWIIATIPIFVALLGWQFLGERMSRFRILGIVIGAIGVILVISDGHISHFLRALPDQLGNAYILLSALNWAVFTVLSKRWLFTGASAPEAEAGGRSDFGKMIQAMLRLMLMGWVFMLPWLVGSTPLGALTIISPSTMRALLFLGIACSGLAYIFWYGALTRLEATETSALLYAEPLVTQAVAWFYLAEPLNWAIFVGGAVIMLGVWLVGRQ